MYAQRVHDIGAMYGHGIDAQVEAACDLFVRLAIDNRLTGFRAAFVFEQTEGKPLPEFSKTTGNPREFADKLKEFVANRESRWNTTSPFPQPRKFPSEAKFG
jgi:hypothetical protein